MFRHEPFISLKALVLEARADLRRLKGRWRVDAVMIDRNWETRGRPPKIINEQVSYYIDFRYDLRLEFKWSSLWRRTGTSVAFQHFTNVPVSARR